MLRLRAHQCHDPATNRTAFSFLAPSDWPAQTAMHWNPQAMIRPVVPTASAQAPDGSAWMTLLPNGAFAWVDGGRWQEGSMDFGVAYLRPRPAAEVLAWAFPSLRPGIADFRVTDVVQEPAPPWASERVQQVVPGDDSIRASVEYTMRGVPYREVVSLVLRVGDPTPMPTAWGIVGVRYWFTYPALAIGAPVERWAEHQQALDAIRQTFRVDPNWFPAVQAYMNQQANNALVQQQTWFAAQQATHRAQVAMGEQLIRSGQEVSNAMSDAVMGTWEQRNASYDRIYDNQHLATMGVSRYDDPAMPVPVELPHGYDGVWGDGQGGYVLAEDYSYDPNVGASGPGPTWQRLTKVDP